MMSTFLRGRKIFVAAALVVLLCLCGACAGKHGGEAGKAPVSDPVAGPGKAAQGPRAVQAAPDAAPEASAQNGGLSPQSSGQGSGQNGAQTSGAVPAKGAPQKARVPVVEQLLASAGQDAAARKPEAGFALSVPDRVWAGEPFLIQAGGQGLRSVTAAWRGKSVSARPGVDGQSAGTAVLMLSVLQKQQETSLPIALTLEWDSGKVDVLRADIPVSKHKHPVQSLRVQKKYVTPDPSVEEKIKQDQREVRDTIAKISPVRYWRTPFLRPVPGEVTSIYGLRRVFNGKELNPHRGIDFDAKEGDPILACDDGVVALVSDHYYGGQTVIVDHGLGVFSLYLHLSGFNVQAGQAVKRGDVVGFIGSTGRVTGPHLHLSLAVLGEMVDAAPCIEDMGKIEK